MVLGKLRSALAKTRAVLAAGLGRLFALGRKLDQEFLDELEQVLYQADLGNVGTRVVAELQDAYRQRRVQDVAQVPDFLRQRLLALLAGAEAPLARSARPPTVVLVVGVNGSGKTTSIAKLAHHLVQQGHQVLLGAGDTFRAAAVEQLSLWADRLHIPIVKQATGADPAAVAYDAVAAAVARGVDYLILDTAGRLHTQKNLMEELRKVVRVVQKQLPAAPHETLLVLDATTGQNAIRQASEFARAVPLTGLLLAKMDGTAKGGAVFGIRDVLPVPIKFVGVGEGIEDLEVFQAAPFVDAVLAVDKVQKA